MCNVYLCSGQTIEFGTSGAVTAASTTYCSGDTCDECLPDSPALPRNEARGKRQPDRPLMASREYGDWNESRCAFLPPLFPHLPSSPLCRYIRAYSTLSSGATNYNNLLTYDDDSGLDACSYTTYTATTSGRYISLVGGCFGSAPPVVSGHHHCEDQALLLHLALSSVMNKDRDPTATP